METLPDGFSRMFLKNRDRHIFCRSRQRRASKNDGVRALLVLQRRANIFTHSFQIRQIKTSIDATRRADADERDIRVEDPFRRRYRGFQQALRQRLGDKI